jgi:hypothetical protein
MKRHRVLEWRTFNLWSKQFLEITKDLLNEKVLDKFRAEHAFDGIYSDNIRWLEEIVKSVVPEVADGNLEGELTRRLMKYYSAVRAFHAGCAQDVSSYYEKGLIPLDTEAAAAAVKSHFLGGDFPELSESDLDAVIRDTSLETIEGRVYFNLDERFLIEHCGHYLLYGSEYVVGLATSLCKDRAGDYRKSLKNVGRPTMFICDIPWSLISDGTKSALTQTFVAELFRHLKFPSYRPSTIDFGFSIQHRLPPSQIAGHYYPEGVRDPIK